jgi:hypothetical protein
MSKVDKLRATSTSFNATNSRNLKDNRAVRISSKPEENDPKII